MMISLHRQCIALAFVFVLLGIAGCGGQYDSSVSGLVTLDGQIVPRGTVSYQPQAGGPPGYALVKEDGSYVVQTGREAGLRSGEYVVTITANEAPSAPSANGGPPPPGKAITPLWYRSKDTSGLKFNIESGHNEINLELKSQPPAGVGAR